MAALLLDTHAVLWLMNGEPLSEAAREAIASGEAADGLFVSPFSAWEIATLVRKSRVMLSMSPEAWFEALSPRRA
jgi:PIN domain nuclease of toxin-antitoxin system